jgi:hypothetical protein
MHAQLIAKRAWFSQQKLPNFLEKKALKKASKSKF